MKKVILIVFLLAVAGSAGGWYYMRKSTKEPEVRTAQISRGDIVGAEAGHHAGMGGGAADIDAAQAGMGVWTPHDRHVQHSGSNEVVEVAARAHDETPVLDPLHGDSDVVHAILSITVTACPARRARGRA